MQCHNPTIVEKNKDGNAIPPAEKEKKAPTKPKKVEPTEHVTFVVAKPKPPLIQFAICTHTCVKPRMNVEKELVADIIPNDQEMLLSIAKLIEKIHLRHTSSPDQNFLACV